MYSLASDKIDIYQRQRQKRAMSAGRQKADKPWLLKICQKNKAEKDISNQSGEFDYSKAASQLAVAAAQLRTIDQIRKNLGGKK